MLRKQSKNRSFAGVIPRVSWLEGFALLTVLLAFNLAPATGNELQDSQVCQADPEPENLSQLAATGNELQDSQVSPADPEPENLSQFTVDFPRPSWENRNQACNIFIGVDEIMFDLLERNMTDIVLYVQDHVDELNNIFTEEVFDFGSDSNRYFRLSRVQVIFGMCDDELDNETCSNYESYLETFNSMHDFSNFCFAFLFTTLDFRSTNVGQAFFGTLCLQYYNTGYVSFINEGEVIEFEQSSLIFAHEVGHILGAEHDEEFETCKDKGFIMSEHYDTITQRAFSPCSIESMKMGLRNLTQNVEGREECFVNLNSKDLPPAVEVSLCGNGIVEPGEECDCGINLDACYDEDCCPADMSKFDRSWYWDPKPCEKTVSWPYAFIIFPILPGIIGKMGISVFRRIYS